jgi:hypothetical protein
VPGIGTRVSASAEQRNVVALAPPLFGLLAATYEITIALLMLSKGRYARWGLIGGIVFLIGITPLGDWTLANPVMAVAMAYLLTREYDRSLQEMLRSALRPRRERGRGPVTTTSEPAERR